MSMRLPALVFYCVLLSPLHLSAADKNEIEIFIRRGQEHQNRAFQAGPEEKKRHLRKAIEEYEKIYYLAPDEDSAYILAGSCYEHLGEFQKAAETYAIGAERVSSQNKKLMLLSNVARVNTNLKNLRGVASVIAQMEFLDPLAIEIAAASRDMAMDSSDEQTRARYAEKCVRICDYHIKKSKNADIREQASNIKRGLEDYLNPVTSGANVTVQSGQYPDPWKGILSAARNKEYEKVVISHRNMLTAASRLDPLSKSYVNPVPAYLPYLNALLESYVRIGHWDGLFEVARRTLLRRVEIQDESFRNQPVSAMLPALNDHLKSYLASPRTLNFGRPGRTSLIPRLWLYEIKGDALSVGSVNDKNEAFPDPDVLAVGWWGRGGRSYRIVLRFSLPPALSGLTIQQAVVSLLREHGHITAGSHEDGLPVLCAIESSKDQGLKDSPPRCPQAKQVLPDAESLMRRDIGKTFGGYTIGQLYSFDIMDAIKAGRNEITHATVIMLRAEPARAFRSFWSTRSSHSPKVSVIVRSETKPGMDDVFEYEEDWVDLYARGLAYVQKGRIGAASVLWEEAAKRSGGERAAKYIREHLAIIKGARR